MKEIKVDLGKEYSKKIAMDSTAKLLFFNLEPYDEIIIDFKNVEFCSMSFLQSYIYHKHHSNKQVREINMSDYIEYLLGMLHRISIRHSYPNKMINILKMNYISLNRNLFL